MAGLLPGDTSNDTIIENRPTKSSEDKQEETSHWYFARKEIEENSPSRRDGIDLKKETCIRKSYCTYLQDLGMKLKVPQVTIATAIIFCHRFFIHQSHAKNDRRIIATVCMFLAGKVEETPRPLKDVILVSYEIIHKKDPAAAQRIKQKEVYEQQKELILVGERVVLVTLGFELNVHHPYKPLVEAIKKFNIGQHGLAQVAWNFVNDGLKTSLCLQFKPHHIAAGAIFLAAKFLKVKLPSDGEKVWWQEFDVTPRQLEEVSNQMLELYEQTKVPPSQGSEVEGSAGGVLSLRNSTKAQATNEELASKPPSSHPAPEESYVDNQLVLPKSTEHQSNVIGSAERDSVITEHKEDVEIKDGQPLDQLPRNENLKEVSNNSNSQMEQVLVEDQSVEASECNISSSIVSQSLDIQAAPNGQSPVEAFKIDKDKVKAALEKRRKSHSEMTQKKDIIDEDDLIERALEEGVELAAEDEKTKQEKSCQSRSKSECPDLGMDLEHTGDETHPASPGMSSAGLGTDSKKEAEMLDSSSALLNGGRKEDGSPFGTKLEEEKQPIDPPSDSHETGV